MKKRFKISRISVILSPKINCRIKDISTHGLGFMALSEHKVQKDQSLKIIFSLDDSVKTVLKKRAVVRRVNDNFIGCEFLETEKEDRAVGFYVL